MHRSPVSSVLLVACGVRLVRVGQAGAPKPPPAGASSYWNNGDTGTTALPGSAGTATAAAPGYSGFIPVASAQNTNLANICTAAQQQKTWATMDVAPIQVPNTAANLNLAGVAYKGADGKVGSTCSTPGECTMTGPTTWQGLTIQQAEQVLCQGTGIGDAFGDGNQDIVWGGNGEVNAEYIVSNNRIDYLGIDLIGNGYLGNMTFTSPDGTTSYTLSLQSATPLTQSVNGSAPTPITLNWAGYFDGTDATAINQFDLLYRAFENTYFHSIWTGNPEPAGTTCNQTGGCVLGQFSNYYAYFSIPSSGWGFWVSAYLTPAGQYPNRIDIYLSQLLNYAGAEPYLALNAKGPFTLPELLRSATTPCSLAFGLDYGSFLTNCVQTDNNATANGSDLNELLSLPDPRRRDLQLQHPGGRPELQRRETLAHANHHRLEPRRIHPDAPEFAAARRPCERAEHRPVHAGEHRERLRDLAGEPAPGSPRVRRPLGGVPAPRHHERLPRSDGSPTRRRRGRAHRPLHPDTRPGDGRNQRPELGSGEIREAESPMRPRSAAPARRTSSARPPRRPLDPVNVGPATALAIDPNYALGMKLGHQKGVFCLDAESSANIQTQLTLGSSAPGPQYCAAPYGEEDDLLTATAESGLGHLGAGQYQQHAHRYPGPPLLLQDVRRGAHQDAGVARGLRPDAHPELSSPPASRLLPNRVQRPLLRFHRDRPVRADGVRRPPVRLRRQHDSHSGQRLHRPAAAH